jgi:hypothetical protein
MPSARARFLCATFLVGGLVAGAAPFSPIFSAEPAFAQQRVQIRSEFRAALEPHGKFARHERYGEVWRPGRIAKGWRPYTVGRWVYTDRWGWFWNADQAEGDWGWVVYHYGRWVNDRAMGWVWVPGDQWGPAWVNWRRGARPDARYIGWSPLPPDDVVIEYRDNPDVWIFVRGQDIIAPSIQLVIVREQPSVLLQQTVIVNRTVIVRDRGVIVNPGIAPAIVAAYAGRPIVSYEVRPRVIVGTSRVAGAIEVSETDIRDRARFKKASPVIRETAAKIEPVRDIPPPKQLEPKEEGRLGERPPTAIKEDAPPPATAPGQKPPVAEKPPADKPSTDKPTTKPAPGEKPVTGKPADKPTDKPPVDKPVEKPTADKPTTKPTPGEKPVTGKPTDKPTDKPPMDKPVEKPTADKPTSKPTPGEKPVTGKPADKSPVEKPPVAKPPVAKPPAGETPAARPKAEPPAARPTPPGQQDGPQQRGKPDAGEQRGKPDASEKRAPGPQDRDKQERDKKANAGAD